MKKLFCALLVCICMMVCAVPVFADDISSSVVASSAASSASSASSGSSEEVPDTPFTEFVPVLISQSWEFFSIPVPGFGMSFGEMWLGIGMVSISIVVIHFFFGFGGSGNCQYRSGSSGKAKISDDRKHDQL
jgi:hypothetical protein